MLDYMKKILFILLFFNVFFLIIITLRIHCPLASEQIYMNERIDFKQIQKEDVDCWNNNFISLNSQSKTTDNLFTLNKDTNFIPSNIEEAPIGQVPTVPKQFFIEENNFCFRKNLTVIAYVHTSIQNVKRRQITRDTWGSSTEPIGTVFVVGKAKNKKEQEIVDNESAKFHDIIQGNYTDLYKLLTYKALNSMYWILKNCEHVPWVVHADDDTLIDVKMLFKYIHNCDIKQRTSEIFCTTLSEHPVRRRGKMTMTRNECPCNTYPIFCRGGMWFSSMKIIKKLYANIPRVKYLWTDDVYLTGLVTEVSHIPITMTNFCIQHFDERKIGKQLAWLNLQINRTKNWQSILSYYLK